MELLTAARMRAIEQAAIDGGSATGLDLMERAGRGVVEAILERRPERAAAPGAAVVLCGPGNNGGDGFVAARLLKGKGWEVSLFAMGDAATLPPDAATNRRRWREIGEIGAWRDREVASALSRDGVAIVIDALFGGGLSRPLEAVEATLSTLAAERRKEGRRALIVAVDAPSGLCLDSGRALGGEGEQPRCVEADLTVTFHRLRIGHVVGAGAAACGDVRVVDIGLRSSVDDGSPTLRQGPTVALDKAGGHKYAHGHALVLSGGVGRGGAARLAARGALRIGAGLVTLGAPPAALIENAAQLNAVMLARIGDAEALSGALTDRRVTAVALGPGLGVGEATRAMTRAVLGAASKPAVVLDADALTSFADMAEELFELTSGARAVLTPHGGEFRRLFPDIEDRLSGPPSTGPAFSKVDAARDAARRAGCVVLLKGPDTVVADASGAASVVSAQYDRACPWLATAGAGDVLTGMIAGLLARGFGAKAAAETACWLHQEAALDFGPGLIAEDLPERLPAILRRVIRRSPA